MFENLRPSALICGWNFPLDQRALLIEDYLFIVFWDVGGPAFFGGDFFGEGMGRFGFAVDDEYFFRCGADAAQPSDQFGAVGVGGEAVDFFNRCVDGPFFSVNPDFVEPFEDEPTEGSDGLIADEEDGVFCVGDVVF